MKQAYIFVDNLRIGGYQRLTLDQAYRLADLGYLVEIVVLDASANWELKRIENDLLEQRNVSVLEAKPGFFSLLRFISCFHFGKTQDELVITHSLRAAVVLRLFRVSSRSKITVNTMIHQLPELTHLAQRVKRFFYSQFADNLFCFSAAVQNRWYAQFRFIPRYVLLRFTKEIHLLRNGVYFDRLPVLSDFVSPRGRPRIIFLGRLTFWKGIETLSNLSTISSLNHFDFVFFVPSSSNSNFRDLVLKLGERATVVEGKSIADYVPMHGDVHIYPANYGPGVRTIESISLNCLEMGSIGIPTLITAGGYGTWPEFSGSDLFMEVEWDDSEKVADAIRICTNRKIHISDLINVRYLADVGRQIERLQQFNQ